VCSTVDLQRHQPALCPLSILPVASRCTSRWFSASRAAPCFPARPARCPWRRYLNHNRHGFFTGRVALLHDGWYVGLLQFRYDRLAWLQRHQFFLAVFLVDQRADFYRCGKRIFSRPQRDVGCCNSQAYRQHQKKTAVAADTSLTQDRSAALHFPDIPFAVRRAFAREFSSFLTHPELVWFFTSHSHEPLPGFHAPQDLTGAQMHKLCRISITAPRLIIRRD